MRKSVFSRLASLAVCLLMGMPAFAQTESVVTTAGNAYVTAGRAFVNERRGGIGNWNEQEAVISYYFRAQKAGKMSVALQAMGDSKIEVSVLGKKKKVTLKSAQLERVELGEFKVKAPGYIRMDVRGVKINKGQTFGTIASVIVGGEVAPVVCVSPEFSSHFGRRGPSCHLGYPLPKENVEWFYNEVIVPEEGDIPSSYYMACGFGQGYFGMQNNSPHKRRVLFSVWSPFETDNPADIPDSLRVTLLKKGENVIINDFGNEGSGGQSYMHYDWKAGERCRFLAGVKPDGKGNTIYTAYFYDNHKGKWVLVASWRRPQTSTWYTGAHSFLENFNPTMGYINRKAYYTNQWARTADGRWVPITKARYTCDTTGHEQMRLDYTGGAEGDKFFMSMGGFFNDYTKSGTFFDREPGNMQAPDIDFSTLE